MCIGLFPTLQVIRTEISNICLWTFRTWSTTRIKHKLAHTYAHSKSERITQWIFVNASLKRNWRDFTSVMCHWFSLWWRTVSVLLCICLRCKLTEKEGIMAGVIFLILTVQGDIHQMCRIWWGRVCANTLLLQIPPAEQLNLSNQWFTTLLKGTTAEAVQEGHCYCHFCYLRALCNSRRDALLLHLLHVSLYLCFNDSSDALYLVHKTGTVCKIL